MSAPPLSVFSADVSGRNFILTGATSGLGRCIAEELAKHGAAQLVISGRHEERGEQVTKSLAELGSQVRFVRCELENEQDCNALVDEAAEFFGDAGVHGLVNAAATTERCRLQEMTTEFWDRMMNINVRAPAILTQKTAALMKQRGIRGSIVNISSIASHVGAPHIAIYAVSKGALNSLTRVAAVELREHGIRVNAINMGWTFTEYEDALQKKEKGENWLAESEARHKMGRLLRPIDIAATVGHLLSDAALMMTGSIIDLHPEMVAGELP